MVVDPAARAGSLGVVVGPMHHTSPVVPFVLASKGDAISGLDTADSDTQKVFHAGTSADDGNIVTSGGRVLCVVGLGDTVRDAAAASYSAVEKIGWNDVYFRRDIGHRAIAREEHAAS